MQLIMPRRAVTYRFDERVIEALKARSKKANSSASNWLETLLIETLMRSGDLPADFEPLGETRGGDRTKGSEDDQPS